MMNIQKWILERMNAKNMDQINRIKLRLQPEFESIVFKF